jgi:hypothetical protein
MRVSITEIEGGDREIDDASTRRTVVQLLK